MSAATEQTPQAKRTFALERAHLEARDLTWYLAQAVSRNETKPYKQKDRAELKKHAREILRLIEARLEDATT